MKKRDVKLIASAAKKLVKTRKNEIIFLTATFASKLYDRQANAVFCLFLKNCVKTYGFEEYVWTKELQERGVPHYHFLCDYPYQPITVMQEAFNHSVRHICGKYFPVSSNSLRLPAKRERSIVKDHKKVAGYIAKYASKSVGEQYPSRCWAISKGLYPLYVNVTDEDAQSLKDTFNAKIYASDFASTSILKDFDYYEVESMFTKESAH